MTGVDLITDHVNEVLSHPPFQSGLILHYVGSHRDVRLTGVALENNKTRVIGLKQFHHNKVMESHDCI